MVSWFGKLPGFRQAMRPWAYLKQEGFAHLFAPQDGIHITDGVPIPICHLARASRSKLFKGEAAFGLCAAKDEQY